MTDTLHRIRESRAVEAVDPSMGDALEWAEQHVDIDRVSLTHVLWAYCAGRRHELERMNAQIRDTNRGLTALQGRMERLGADLAEMCHAD